jgi:3'-5' exoribonuclease
MKLNNISIGDSIGSERLVLAAADIRQTAKKKDYLTATFTDGTESISGNIWDWVGPLPELKKVYCVTANVGEYLGTKQLQNITMGIADDQDMTDFCCRFIDNPERVWENCMHAITNIHNPALRWVCFNIYTDYKQEIMNASGARSIHHAGIGGNIQHTWEVMTLGRGISSILQLERSLLINDDLVTAGAALHDIGKPRTYSIDGAVIESTEIGILEDHIANGIAIVREYFLRYANLVELPLHDTYLERTEALLIHIIASHHGEYAWGSPTTPKCMEAYIVHYADKISATIETLRAANYKAENEGKGRTDKIYTLNNYEHVLQHTVSDILGAE